MALVLKSIYNFYNFLFNEFKDPRVEQYPFLGSPFPLIFLVAVYLYFVLKWGPQWMADRKPYDLTWPINVYNFVQVIVNLCLGVVGMYNSYLFGDLNFTCAPINHITSPAMTNIVLVTYIYYIMKLVDLIDTVFFVLRKKNNQITFLHVYHHAGMVFASYICSKFIPGSHATMLGLINSFVHAIMYGYYFLTSFKPELKQSIWWKKHITQLQLAQFAFIVMHFLIPLVFVECAYPKPLSFIGLSQNLFMFAMFSDFYLKTYVKRKSLSK